MPSWFPPSSPPSHRHSSPRRAFVRPHSPSASATSRGAFSRPHRASTSSYKRSPREGYIARLVSTIRKLLRSLIRYARENPMKMFTLVVMPLITGGVLTKVLATMGLRLPAALAGMVGGGAGRGGGAMGGAMEGIGGVEGVVKIAKMFM